MKRPFWRPTRRWFDAIKMDLKEIKCEGVNWIKPAQDTLRWRICEHGNETSYSIKRTDDFLAV
jgi:hypothetical protein